MTSSLMDTTKAYKQLEEVELKRMFFSTFHIHLLYKSTEMQPSVGKQAGTYNSDTEQYVGV